MINIEQAVSSSTDRVRERQFKVDATTGNPVEVDSEQDFTRESPVAKSMKPEGFLDTLYAKSDSLKLLSVRTTLKEDSFSRIKGVLESKLTETKAGRDALHIEETAHRDPLCDWVDLWLPN